MPYSHRITVPASLAFDEPVDEALHPDECDIYPTMLTEAFQYKKRFSVSTDSEPISVEVLAMPKAAKTLAWLRFNPECLAGIADTVGPQLQQLPDFLLCRSFKARPAAFPRSGYKLELTGEYLVENQDNTALVKTSLAEVSGLEEGQGLVFVLESERLGVMATVSVFDTGCSVVFDFDQPKLEAALKADVQTLCEHELGRIQAEMLKLTEQEHKLMTALRRHPEEAA
jgi:hypothetical protein